MYTCIILLFGWPQSLYTDNGTHFTNSAITAIYQMHRVLYYKASITHSFLIGLIKKNVQLLVSTIKNIYVSKGNTYKWSQQVIPGALAINRRIVRIYRYTLA